jgi:hypothetical protein
MQCKQHRQILTITAVPSELAVCCPLLQCASLEAVCMFATCLHSVGGAQLTRVPPHAMFFASLHLQNVSFDFLFVLALGTNGNSIANADCGTT